MLRSRRSRARAAIFSVESRTSSSCSKRHVEVSPARCASRYELGLLCCSLPKRVQQCVVVEAHGEIALLRLDLVVHVVVEHEAVLDEQFRVVVMTVCDGHHDHLDAFAVELDRFEHKAARARVIVAVGVRLERVVEKVDERYETAQAVSHFVLGLFALRIAHRSERLRVACGKKSLDHPDPLAVRTQVSLANVKTARVMPSKRPIAPRPS